MTTGEGVAVLGGGDDGAPMSEDDPGPPEKEEEEEEEDDGLMDDDDDESSAGGAAPLPRRESVRIVTESAEPGAPTPFDGVGTSADPPLPTQDDASSAAAAPTKKKKPPLPIGWWERIRFGLLWGLNLAQQDFEKYLLYFMLTHCSEPACGYLDTYAVWLLVASIIAFPVNIFSGWITDYTAKYQHRVQQVSLVLQTIGLVAMTACAYTGHSVLAQIFYQIRQAAIVQSMTSVWKILKIRIDVVTANAWIRDPNSLNDGRMKDLENIVVSSVGNFGDISAEVAELSSLGAITLLSRFISADATGFIIICISLGMSLVPLVLSFTIRTRDLIVPKIPGVTDATPPPGSASPATTNPVQIAASPDTASQAPLLGAAHARTDTTTTKGKLLFAWRWLMLRLRYLVRTPTVFNTVLHSLLILVMYNLFTYPITVLVGTEDNETHSSSYEETIDNYCGGTLINLIEQGAIVMATYLVSSFMYLAVLVRCPPRIYYNFALPVLSVVTAASALAVLFLRNTIPGIATKIVVAVAQVLPYYINAFTYYVMNTAIRQEYYGVIMAVYAFGVQSILAGTSAVLYLAIPMELLVWVCIGLIVVCTIHGFWMRRLFVNPNWASA